MHINFKETLTCSVLYIINSNSAIPPLLNSCKGVYNIISAGPLKPFHYVCNRLSHGLFLFYLQLPKNPAATNSNYFSEKLDISSIMHDNYLWNSLRAGNKEDSSLSGPHSSCLPLDMVILSVVTLDYLYSQRKQTDPQNLFTEELDLCLSKCTYPSLLTTGGL